VDGLQVERVGKNCLHWNYGYCSCLSVLERHEQKTGEKRTFLVKPEDCACEDWGMAYRLSYPEVPGGRPRYHNPNSEIALESMDPRKPNVLPALEASSYMIVPDPKSAKRDEGRGEG